MDLDTTGLKCPLPIVRITQAIRRMGKGEHLRVLADDPAFAPDVRAWCRKTGNTLISIESDGPRSVAVVRKEA